MSQAQVDRYCEIVQLNLTAHLTGTNTDEQTLAHLEEGFDLWFAMTEAEQDRVRAYVKTLGHEFIHV